MERISLGVAQDHILALTKFRSPVIAIEELIWNALDADATTVEVGLFFNAMDGLERIVVSDNGHGIPLTQCRTAFGNIGGSLKLKMKQTPLGRRPHGKSGRGRLKAFGLGRTVSWDSRYRDNGKCFRYSITGHKATINSLEISDARELNQAEHGVTVEISSIDTNFPSLLKSDDAALELSHRLALYLNQYPGISIVYDGHRISAKTGQSHIESYPLIISVSPTEHFDAELTIIEWKHSTNRALYLCDRQGFARHELPPGIQAKGWEFTAYIKSDLIEKLDDDDAFGLEELHPGVKAIIDTSKEALRIHFRKREQTRASDLVKQWRDDKVYPYDTVADDPVALAEREVFDVCAMNVHEYLPDFENLNRANKLLTFKLIKQALEANPTSLQTILREVLSLPPDKQDDLAKLLEHTKLSAIINAAKIVCDRLKFLNCLDQLLFGEFQATLNEPRQLHPILSQEMWIFGEQYGIGVDEESLTSVLKSHLAILERDSLTTDREQVKDLDGKDRFLDLMLYRQYPQPTKGQFEHLVIELKRPSIYLGMKEINQIERYAFTVANDQRFNKEVTQWTFLLIGNDLDDFARNKCEVADRQYGHIYSGRVNIHVRPWSIILAEARWRYDFFRSKLEYQATKDDAMGYLREKYSQYFPTVESLQSQAIYDLKDVLAKPVEGRPRGGKKPKRKKAY